MDSATLLAWAKTRGDVVAVSFMYGSKHNAEELEAGFVFCRRLGVNRTVVDLSSIFAMLRSDLLLSGGEIPTGHYAAENMKKTVVPGRNTIFNSVLMGLAESNNIDCVLVGAHSGDHHIYPDCRPGYLSSMEQAFYHATEGKVTFESPFATWDKAKILNLGYELGVDYSLTRTCYTSDKIACGKCGSCNERLEAFRMIGRTDPLEYAA